MLTSHFPLPFAGHRLHIVDFDASSFREHDLLWPTSITIGSGLPDASVKLNIWQAALPPFMRYARWASGQCPVWATSDSRYGRTAYFGSISHCATTALAVISRQRIGIDIEKIMSQQHGDRAGAVHY
ncbi:phosphopantetheinyltransferase component of enterobactin synthase multienzyme complex [Salmonella enterica subsp. enterica]|uniref:Phosphopantetheinyltransferase component of enterobactin synthase multienzyme complex n=1 Tax=Salmonella enterica I TaxID=59201 RepID=A0A3S4KDS4_SALET|nr:phosphopantetheinyltransferase component of enterobactin synthase multienzyme complex [Salmonella enterica subsp. enterica]